MFSKLLKHEWRSSRGTMLALCLSIPGMAVISGLLLRLIAAITKYPQMMDEDEFILPMLLVASSLSMAFMIFAMFGCAAAAYIVLLVRFYRSRFTDEGYLTFTLPVKTSHILLAPVLNMVIWSVILSAVLLLSLVIMLLIGLLGTASLSSDPIQYSFSGESALLLLPLQLFCGLLYAPMLATGSITLGCTIAKKHRVLASFGIFYAVTMVVSMITAILQFVLISAMDGSIFRADAYLWISGLTGIAIQLGVIVGSWFLSQHLMKHRLNLP